MAILLSWVLSLQMKTASPTNFEAEILLNTIKQLWEVRDVNDFVDCLL